MILGQGLGGLLHDGLDTDMRLAIATAMLDLRITEDEQSEIGLDVRVRSVTKGIGLDLFGTGLILGLTEQRIGTTALGPDLVDAVETRSAAGFGI